MSCGRLRQFPFYAINGTHQRDHQRDRHRGVFISVDDWLRRCFIALISLGLLNAPVVAQDALTAAQSGLFPVETPGVVQRLPAFHERLSNRLERRLAFSGSALDFKQWKIAAREKVFACLLEPPPAADFDVEVVASQDFGSYRSIKIHLNITSDSRVLGYLLVPNSSGPHPAVLLLHDHGAKFDIGKEKVIRPWGIAAEKIKSAEDWVDQYYGGRFIGDELAKSGFVCFATDMLNWSDRGGGGFEQQQALAANLLQFGVSWSGLIAHEDMRAAEFIAGLPEVDRTRVTAMGLSVGGYRTWQVAALSENISSGVSVCWMATARGLLVPGNNQTTGQSAFTMLHPGLSRYLDYPDIASIACPKPMMFLCGKKDRLFPEQSTAEAFSVLRDVWQSQGADNSLITRFYDAPHEFNAKMQADACEWLKRLSF